MKSWRSLKTNPFPVTYEHAWPMILTIRSDGIQGARLDNFLEDVQISNLNLLHLKDWKRDSDLYL